MAQDSESQNETPVDRVAAARARVGGTVKEKFEKARVIYPARHLLFRAFKEEGELEIWGRDRKKDEFTRIAVYPILKASGLPGPKRVEGDRQVPEGFYKIDRFNPQSRFHLSLGINYPNGSDLILSDREQPGTDIFIHGSNLTIGCLPMGDDKVEEIYLIAADANNRGTSIPIHLYPCRFSQENWEQLLEPHLAGLENPESLRKFWKTLEKEYRYFERRHRLASIQVASDGQYEVRLP